MKRIINKDTGIFIRDDVVVRDGEIALDVAAPQGFYWPRWDGKQWVEGKTAAEIVPILAAQLAQQAETEKIEKRKAAEIEATRISIAKLVVADTLTPDEVQKVTWLFDEWKAGFPVAVGSLLIYNDSLYKVIQAHTTQADWTPDKTPALFKSTLPEGEIGPWVQPTGAHDAYNIGDKVLFNGKTYESTINANVWSLTAYSAGWKIV